MRQVERNWEEGLGLCCGELVHIRSRLCHRHCCSCTQSWQVSFSQHGWHYELHGTQDRCMKSCHGETSILPSPVYMLHGTHNMSQRWGCASAHGSTHTWAQAACDGACKDYDFMYPSIAICMHDEYATSVHLHHHIYWSFSSVHEICIPCASTHYTSRHHTKHGSCQEHTVVLFP